MSGKMRIGGLVLAAALVVLGTGICFGQDPCGGTYSGEGLKAVFWPYYDDLNLMPSNILNDFGLLPYQYQVPGGDCVFLYRRGHVVVDVNRPEKSNGTDEDRYVQMNLVLKLGSGYCANTPATLRLTHIHTVSFHFLTEKEFIPIKENGKLILTCLKYGWNYLNFATMTPGQTTYTQISITFKVFGDPEEYRFDTQARVYYGELVNSAGGLGWEITPIYEPYVVRVLTTKGKRITNIENTDHDPSVYQNMGNCDPTTGLGVYEFPFKLVLKRLN
jgi:hypothetical protein